MHDRSHDIDRAAAGTCEWLLRHKTYRSWATCDRGMLWIKGKPGSGKSTLLKYALDKCGRASDAGDLILSFFFHGRGDKLQRSPLGLFRSLLHQVLSQVPDALPDLVDTFEKKLAQIGKPDETWQWHKEELQRFFELSLSRVLKTRLIWLFVDALDECGNEDAVDLIDKFKSLLQSIPSTRSQFRICFTCRHYPILDPGVGSTILLDTENNADISSYVQGRFFAAGYSNANIEGLISDRAQGVFMWAHLVVERVLQLERQSESRERVEAEITKTPQALHDLYRELIRGAENRPRTLELIQWICFSTRPLTTDELQWAMAVDPDGAHKSLDECQKSDKFIADDKIDGRIKVLSCGLAEIVPSSGSRVVQFIHQSMKDFVEKGLDSSATSTDTAIGVAHHRLSKICIRYLAMEEIGRSTSDELNDFPFLHYATTSWVAHAKHSNERNVPQNDILECFAWPSNALMDLWVWAYESLDISDDRPPENTSLAHIASKYQWVGLSNNISQAADRIGISVDSKDGYGWTPLTYAAEAGNEAIVKQLLAIGKVTPAFKQLLGTGKIAPVFKKLLATGKVKVDSRDNAERTPLSRAAGAGHEVVVRLLLATGKANVKSKDLFGRTPLSYAAEAGCEPVVKLLLATGKVNVKSKDDDGRTPLSRAAENGHEATVKLLLGTSKVGVNSMDGKGRTPLSWAAENGREAVVRLLLATGKVDVDLQGKKYGRTPFSWAAKNGHEAVVRLLLATGKVDVESQDKGHETPSFSWVSENGRWLETMIAFSADRVEDEPYRESGRTPLSWAAENGHEAIVELLLATGKVDADSKDKEDGRTPLSWAAENGHEAVVKLLLATGKVDVASKDGNGLTPMSWATEKGHEAVVKLLLATGEVDVESKDERERAHKVIATLWRANVRVVKVQSPSQQEVWQ